MNPVAVLSVAPKDGQRTRVFAFSGNTADNLPVGAPKAGYKWRLASFEKVPFAHILSIKYDPYEGAFIAWYVGGFGLIGALIFVFFVSHRRVWARIAPTVSWILAKVPLVSAGSIARAPQEMMFLISSGGFTAAREKT